MEDRGRYYRAAVDEDENGAYGANGLTNGGTEKTKTNGVFLSVFS